MRKLMAVGDANPWIWALGGSVVLWLLLSAVIARVSLDSLASNAASAAFLALAALAQLMVVSTGRGAVDLSIPGVITLAAFVSVGTIDGHDSRLLIGLLATLGVGVLVGLVNAATVLALRIPPIIATLAVGYILTTAALIYNQRVSTFQLSPTLTSLARGRVFDVPTIVLVVLAIALVFAFVLNRTVFGRSLTAVGQSLGAAHLAGVKVTLTHVLAYVASGVLASLGGMLISARVGGAFLGMGQSYLLETIGAVVIGGSLIFGGRSTVAGTLFGALFLTLVVTVMEVAGLPIGLQNVAKGVLIILVLILAVRREQR